MKEHHSKDSMPKDVGNPPIVGGTPENPLTEQQVLEQLFQFNASHLAEKEIGTPSNVSPPKDVAPADTSGAPSVLESEPKGFQLPEANQTTLHYRLPDGTRYRVYCLQKDPAKPRSKAFFIQNTDGTVAAERISRAELLKRGTEGNWKFVGIDTVQGELKVEKDVLSMPKSPEEIAAVDRLKTHLKGVLSGQRVRYSGRDGLVRIIEKSSDQGTLLVRTLDDKGTEVQSQFYWLNDLAEHIYSEGWRFQVKDKVNAPTESQKESAPREPGLESAKKTEKRLSDLAAGMKLVYKDDSNTEVTIIAMPEKQPEFLDARFPRNMDDDFPEPSLEFSYKENFGAPKVLRIIREGKADTLITSSDLVKTIYEKKWKFQHGGKFTEQRADAPVIELKTEFLKEGEEAEFDYLIEGKIPMTVKLRREGQQYLSIHPTGAVGQRFTEQEIQALAKSVGFVRRPIGEPVLPVTAEAAVEPLTISVGQTVVLERVSSDGGAVKQQKVERTAEGYFLFDDLGHRDSFPLSEKEFQTLFGGWKKRVEVSAEAVPGVSVPENVPMSVSPEDETVLAAIDAKIEKLGQDLDFERTAYITKKLEQSGAWNRLGKLLHIKKRDGDDDEVSRFKEFYTSKLIEWKDAKLERIRLINSRDERRQAMADLIREIEFEEAERLYDEEQRSRVEKVSVPYYERMKELWEETRGSITAQAHFEDPESGHYTLKEAKGRDWLKLMMGGSSIIGQATLRGIEKTGTAVNKFNKSRGGKYVLAAALAGTGAVAIGGVTAGGAIPIALAIRRLVIGIGVSVAVEKSLKDYTESNRAIKKASYLERGDIQKVLNQVEYDTNATELTGPHFVDLQTLDEFLQKEGIGQIHKKITRRKLSKVFRKGGAILAGAAVGGLIPNDWYPFSSSHAATGTSVGPGAELPTTPAVLRDAAVAPEAAASAAVNGGTVDLASTASTGTVPAPGGVDLAQAGASGAEHVSGSRAVTLANRLNELTSTHTVKPGDSIWKIATDSVKGVPDMDDRATTRFAKLLELRLQEKLTTIDPKLAEAAGFTVDANGNYTPSHILSGAKLELGKLVPADEMAKLIEEAKGDGPITLAAAHTPVPVVETMPAEPVIAEPTEAERLALEQATLEASVPAVPSADEKAEVLGKFNMSTELVGEKGDVMRYVGSLPYEDQEHLFRNFRRITTELFQTNEVMGGEFYDANYDPSQHPELSKTYISRVLQDHKILGKNPFTSYDRLKNPLHGSQMEAVAKFAKAAAKTFGESVAAPRATESVQEYVLRMVAVADNQRLKIPGFRMLK